MLPEPALTEEVTADLSDRRFAGVVLAVCVGLSLTSLVLSITNAPGRWPERTFVLLLFMPALNLVISTFLALIALLIADAKLSLRNGPSGTSAEAQKAFRSASTRLVGWVALIMCIFSTLLGTLTAKGLTSEPGTPEKGDLLIFFLLVISMIILLVAVLYRFIKHYGQGRSRIESVTVDAHMTNGLADNSPWLVGLFYFDPDDPAMMVESRFGLGYTFNYGNWRAVVLVSSCVLLVVGMTLGVLVAAIS